jgi:hypothetical protein
VLNAQELASGFGLQVDVASAAVGDRVEVGYLVNGNFTSLSTPAYSRELTGAVSKLNITVDGAAELADGNYTLATRLVNALGVAGTPNTTGVDVTVDTSGGQVVNDMGATGHSIRGGTGNDTIAGNGGNDTINISQGGVDTLKYNVLSTTDALFGNGLDTVTGFATNKDAVLDAGEDKIDLSAIMTQIETTVGGGLVISGTNVTDYLTATTSGGNTTLLLDRDGAGSGTATALLNLQGVSFLTTDLANMVTAGQIVL